MFLSLSVIMSCIYIVKHKDSDEFYVGGTKDFQKRKYEHKSDYNNENRKCYNRYIYEFIRNNGGWERFDMWKIDCCDEKKQREKEQEYIDKLKPTLNKLRACGFERKHYIREWRLKNKDYDKNEDRIKKRREKFECYCGGRYTREKKAKHFKTKKHINYSP